MAERFSREGKLLAAFDKTLTPQVRFDEMVTKNESMVCRTASHLVRLVLKPSKKGISH